MIKLIHGDATLPSFNELKKTLDSYDELSTTRIDGSSAELKDIREAVETPSFTGKRLVILEDVSRNRSSTFQTELKKYLSDLPAGAEVVLYERKLLPPESALLSLTRDVKTFAERRGLSVFDWSDQVGSRKLEASLTGWEKLIASGEEPEYLLLMLVRQFRLLLTLSAGERIKAPEFVERKMQAQLRFWTERDLKAVYQRLLRMDLENKNGTTPLEVSVPALLVAISSPVSSPKP